MDTNHDLPPPRWTHTVIWPTWIDTNYDLTPYGWTPTMICPHLSDPNWMDTYCDLTHLDRYQLWSDPIWMDTNHDLTPLGWTPTMIWHHLDRYQPWSDPIWMDTNHDLPPPRWTHTVIWPHLDGATTPQTTYLTLVLLVSKTEFDVGVWQTIVVHGQEVRAPHEDHSDNTTSGVGPQFLCCFCHLRG